MASATPSEDQAFLDALKGYGITANDGYGAQDVINYGHAVCTDIRNGYTPSQAAQTVYLTGPPSLTYNLASDFVDIAMAAYCPPDVQW